MIDEMELGEWADGIDRELNRFSAYTGNLAHALKESLLTCVVSINRTFGDDRVGRKVSISQEDGLTVRFCDPRFSDRVLQIIIDASVNRLYYAVFNVPLSRLSGSSFSPPVTALKIDREGSAHLLYREDGTQFSNTSFSDEWSTADQLATYLLQQLIIPVFVDAYFISSTY
jgi:hypothetical protein